MRTRIVLWLAIIAPLVWLLGDVLWEQRIFNFRDVIHYYRPLWQWTSAQWAAGETPLWNSLDGFGQPIHADPTASLFYPGQLLFALPVDFTTRLNLYIIAHLLLAAVSLYLAARGLGASEVGAAAGAISYAYGGHVLFQYCNPIFLVGASWLPLAALATQRMLTLRSYRWSVLLAVVLALMTLGGDPQLAYHVLLGAALYAWLLWRQAKRQASELDPERSGKPQPAFAPRLPVVARSWRSLTQCVDASRAGLLAVAAMVALLLAAIQVLPSAQWSARSERAAFNLPRSVWETGSYLYEVNTRQREPIKTLEGDIVSGIFAPPVEQTHHERVYEFSVAPWRWLEFVWPNIGGKMFPIHQRWMSAIPAESRIWTPSLYLGLAPLLAALGTFSLRRKVEVSTRWLSWLAVWGLLGSLGAYGVGWLMHEVTLGAENTKAIGSPVGGLYWFMVVLLPGYVQFRYPAKLMVLASLGMSLLAARGWDAFARGERRASLPIVGTIAAISASAIAMLEFTRPALLAWLAGATSEFPFGPLDGAGALRGVSYSLAQTALVACAIGCLIGWAKRWKPVGVLLVCLTALELTIAHSWLISTSMGDPPIEHVQAKVTSTSEVPSRFGRNSTLAFERLFNEAPASQQRLDQLSQWECAAFDERWYLVAGINMVDASTGLEPFDTYALTSEQNFKNMNRTRHERYALDGYRRFRFTPDLFPDANSVGFAPIYRRIPTRAYLPSVAIGLPPCNNSLPSQVHKQNAIVLNARQPFPARTRIVYVEHDEFAAHLPRRTIRFDAGPGFCRIERYENNRVDILVNTRQERLLVLADYYASGWTAELVDINSERRQNTPIYRTDRVLRGVLVPAGEHRVIFRYRPLLFYIGFAISGTAWGFLTVGAMFGLARRSRRA